MSLADLRRDYSAGKLDRGNLAADPTDQFRQWFAEASGDSGGRLRRAAIHLYKALRALLGGRSIEPNSMVLATADAEGRPSARTVLLKGVDESGFTFFTNYDSRKGRELNDNSRAALVFYWPELERQVCIAGAVCKLTHEESEAYFHSRPRGSQIGAWASNQSSILQSRRDLEQSEQEFEKKFAGKSVPLPPHWGGYRLRPDRIEFWQGRASRLHDRFQFSRNTDDTWSVNRLSP